MNIAEKPIAAIVGRLTSTGDGIHMIANGYKRTMPCPFQRQGLMLNPTGELFYCENSAKIGNVLDTPAARITVISLPRASEPIASIEPIRVAAGSASSANRGRFIAVNSSASKTP